MKYLIIPLKNIEASITNLKTEIEIDEENGDYMSASITYNTMKSLEKLLEENKIVDLPT